MYFISLVTAPELPITNLVNRCYKNLFRNCSNLISIKVNFTEWNTENMLSWVNRINSSETFIRPSLLIEKYRKNYIQSGCIISNF